MLFFSTKNHLFETDANNSFFILLPIKTNYDHTIRLLFLTNYALLFFLLSFKFSGKKENFWKYNVTFFVIEILFV